MSKIEWTDATWNPIRARRRDNGKVGWHCEKVSPGCANCYAERLNVNGRGGRGTRLPYQQRSREQVELFLDEKTLLAPLRWRKPRMVFPCSMTDLFGEFVPFEWIDKVYAVMALCQQHTFQVLTKRPERRLEWVNHIVGGPSWSTDERVGGEIAVICSKGGKRDWPDFPWPLPNVWELVSVENQPTADERVPILCQTPAAVRGTSYEPALGPVEFTPWMANQDAEQDTTAHAIARGETRGLDWIIVGGESGPGARPFNVAWARSTIEQCRAAGVSVFVKQLGRNPVWSSDDMARKFYETFSDPKGGTMAEWPEDLRVREWPEVAHA